VASGGEAPDGVQYFETQPQTLRLLPR
jgi:hypothetical protein